MKGSICATWFAFVVVIGAILIGPACSTRVSVERDFDYFEPSGINADVTGRFPEGGGYEIGFDVGPDRLMVAGAYRHSPGLLLRVELGRSRQLTFLSREFVFRQATSERRLTVGFWSYPTHAGLVEIRPFTGSLDFLAPLDGSLPKVPPISPARFETNLSLPGGIDPRRPFTMEIPATSASGPLIVTFTPKVARYRERMPRGW